MSKLYIALIADVVRSRSLPPPRRARLQAELRRALSALNRTYRQDLAAGFGLTQGDELQCLLVSSTQVWEIAHAIRYRFAEADWVIGCGRGTVTTSLAAGKLAAPEVAGPSVHAARSVVDTGKRERLLFDFRGLGDVAATLNALASYYSALYWNWTGRQREAATSWRFPAAAGLKVGPSAISHLRRRMAWPLVEAGDKMFRALLEASTT